MSTADTGNRLASLTPTRPDTRSAEVLAGGSMVEAVAGIGGVVLAIIGLAHVFPVDLGAIAAIVLGAGLVLEGGAVAARYARLLEAAGDTAGEEVELGGGMSAEMLGGIACIVLGILSLIGIAPMALEAVTAIVFGATLLLGCATTAGLNRMAVRRWWGALPNEGISRHVASEAVSAANGAQVLVGLGAVVLGIIALVLIPEHHSQILSLVAFLCVGASLLISGAALSGKFLRLVSRRW